MTKHHVDQVKDAVRHIEHHLREDPHHLGQVYAELHKLKAQDPKHFQHDLAAVNQQLHQDGYLPHLQLVASGKQAKVLNDNGQKHLQHREVAASGHEMSDGHRRRHTSRQEAGASFVAPRALKAQDQDERGLRTTANAASPGDGQHHNFDRGTHWPREQGTVEADAGARAVPGNAAAYTGTESTYQAKGTAYYPRNDKMQGGYNDMLGKPLHTLQDYLAGKAPYVSVAMDNHAGIKPGQRVRIPELEAKYGQEIPFRVVDTGSAFRNKGYGRIDIAVKDRQSTYDSTINGGLTLKFMPDV